MPARAPARIEEILTIRDVADYLKVTQRTLYRLVQEGKLPAFKVGNSWRFRRDDLNRWISDQQKLRNAAPSSEDD
jgi:excisionase family DNA binding protein